MGAHLVNGEFQSDKYPTTPRGKVPLSARDKFAQDLLWEYAQRRRVVDAEFSDDLEAALKVAGYIPKQPEANGGLSLLFYGIQVAALEHIRTEGTAIIHSRGYQIRGMHDAMGDQRKRQKRTERHLMYYRDHVLPEISEMLKNLAAELSQIYCDDKVEHIIRVIERRRSPNSAREAVRDMGKRREFHNPAAAVD